MISSKIKEILYDGDIKVATRIAYGEALVGLGKQNENIVVMDCDVAAATMTCYFAKSFPERFFNFGVAEANMMGAAAGISTFGKIPFASTLAVFATRRACDQVAMSIAYPKLNVKICATHAGINMGEDGATHQSIEDISIARTMPNMVVLSPCDGTETRKVIEKITKYVGPCYVRLARSESPLIFNEKYEFEIGKGVKIMDGNKATLIATGFTTSIALQAAKELERENIEIDLINMSTIKPIDKELIIESAKKTRLVVTIEDHSIIGGLGGTVCEVLAESLPTKVIRMGIKDRYGSSGTPEDLLTAFGLDKNSIIKTIKGNIN